MPISVFLFRLFCALIAGAIIGAEREIRHRHGGLTTNSLVSVGACIFILISEAVIWSSAQQLVGFQSNNPFESLSPELDSLNGDNLMPYVRSGGFVNNDNLRVLSQIITGIGFLGAGVIMKHGTNIYGLSSAATIWCSAGLGCLCGYGMWKEAAIAVAFVLFINWGLKGLERKFKQRLH